MLRSGLGMSGLTKFLVLVNGATVVAVSLSLVVNAIAWIVWMYYNSTIVSVL